jgi:hypothetical protein
MTLQHDHTASDCFAQRSYDSERHLCWATFHTGHSIEFELPEIEWERWLAAPSAGQYWNRYLKGRY